MPIGLDRSVHALAAASRPAPNGGAAKDCGGHLLHAVDRLSVAEAAQGSACGAGGMPPEVADSEGIRAVYTVQGYCYRFCRDGTLDRLNHVPVMQRRKWPDERRLPQPV